MSRPEMNTKSLQESTDGAETQLSQSNQRAWDALYRSTSKSIWGTAPAPFLVHFAADLFALLRPGARLLDAGCGEGRNLSWLDLMPGTVVGCDASQGGLDKAKEVAPRGVELHCCELEVLPFADADFDLALLCDTLETLPAVDAVLHELHRVLKPGGWLLCNVPDDDDGIAGIDMQPLNDDGFLYQERYFYRFWDEASARRLFHSVGFRVQRNQVCSWEEASHPGFRDGVHEHTSRVFLLQRVDEGFRP